MSESNSHSRALWGNAPCYTHDLSPHKHWEEHDLPVGCACKECCKASAHRHSFTPGSTRYQEAVSFIRKLGVQKYVLGEFHHVGVVYEDEFGALFQIVCKKSRKFCPHTHSCDRCPYAEHFYL